MEASQAAGRHRRMASEIRGRQGFPVRWANTEGNLLQESSKGVSSHWSSSLGRVKKGCGFIGPD